MTTSAPVAVSTDLEHLVRLAEQALGVPASASLPPPADVRWQYPPNPRGPDGGARSMHVPLTLDGHPGAGFAHQPSIVDAVLRSLGPTVRVVVELGCGEGYNVSHLADAHPHVTFVGLDLLPAHLSSGGATAENAWFAAADFHRLPLAPSSVDLAFSVESLAHAVDLPAALAATRAVLREGGRLVAIELLRTDRYARLPALARRAGELVEALIAVPAQPTVSGFLGVARRAGLVVRHSRDLTGAALPMLTRLARRAARNLDDPAPDRRTVLTPALTWQALRAGSHALYALELVATTSAAQLRNESELRPPIL